MSQIVGFVWKTELTNSIGAKCGCCSNELINVNTWKNHPNMIIFANESWINFKYFYWSELLDTEDIPDCIKKYIALL